MRPLNKPQGKKLLWPKWSASFALILASKKRNCWSQESEKIDKLDARSSISMAGLWICTLERANVTGELYSQAHAQWRPVSPAPQDSFTLSIRILKLGGVSRSSGELELEFAKWEQNKIQSSSRPRDERNSLKWSRQVDESQWYNRANSALYLEDLGTELLAKLCRQQVAQIYP